MMIYCYSILLIFIILRPGNQHIQEITENATIPVESTTDPGILKLDGYQTINNHLDEHPDYFLPNGYPHSDDEDPEEPLYPDYDYDGKTFNYGDASSTSKPRLDLQPNYVPFEDDIPLQTGKDDLPIFLHEPEHAYVIKNRPATLKCSAAKALEVYFKCNGIKSATVNFEFVDPHTGVRIVEGECNVTRDQVEEYFGEDKFQCTCYAWSGRGQIRSRSVDIELAYIKKQFAVIPRAARVEQHAAVTLRCEPPSAEPPAQLYWIKGGAPVATDRNVKIGTGRDLVISSASLQDMANYTCVAENVAGKRITDPALLTVYVNGGWSAWEVWRDCSCQGHPTAGRRRVRTCTAPRPLNGGQTCAGPAVQTTSDCVHCEIDIYVDTIDALPDSQLYTGSWSAWSEWSSCDGDCLQTRRRRCAGGEGGVCAGSDYQLKHCAACNAYAGSSVSSHWPLLAGLAVAAAIFMVMVVMGIKYLKLRSQENTPYIKTRTDDYSNAGGKCVSRPPDLTLHSDRLNSSSLSRPDRQRGTATLDHPRTEHLYEIPQLTNSYTTPADYEIRPANSITSENRYEEELRSDSERSDSSCFISSESSFERESEHISSSLKNNMSSESELAHDAYQSDSTVTKLISSRGGLLQLEKCGVSIYFPEDCVDVNCNDQFRLVIIKDEKCRPVLAEGMTQLSPVIRCGPSYARLRKPAIIQLPHCAMLKNSNWIVSLLTRKQDQNATQWTKVYSLDEELNNKSIFLQVDAEKVYLMTEYLGDFVLVGKSYSGYDIKLLKIAVFAKELYSEQVSNYNLRVYIFEDTLSALYYCLENERALGGQLIDNPKTMYCQDGCSDLCFSLEEIGLGWKARMGSAYQEIPFSHVWNANLNSLHCSFSLEQTDSINSLEFKIVAFQKKCPSNRQVFHVRPQDTLRNLNGSSWYQQPNRNSKNNVIYNVLENPMNSCYLGNLNANEYYTKKETSHMNYDKSYSSSVGYSSRLKLTKTDKRIICDLLDPVTSRGNDWRMLAEKLGVEKGFEYFSARRSPSENVLNLWECRKREISGGALSELATAFRVMERNDCVRIVERYLAPNWL